MRWACTGPPRLGRARARFPPGVPVAGTPLASPETSEGLADDRLHADRTPDTVASHYDDLDEFYRTIWGTHVHHGLWLAGGESIETATDNLVRHAISGLELTSASRVCDVGCGYGETSRLLAKETGADVVGYTVSRAQYDFALAASDRQSSPRFVLQDWLTNTLPDASFDLVLAIESSEHMRTCADSSPRRAGAAPAARCASAPGSLASTGLARAAPSARTDLHRGPYASVHRGRVLGHDQGAGLSWRPRRTSPIA